MSMISEKVRDLEMENDELKAQIMELKEMTGIKEPLPKDCEHCRNYMQHFAKQDGYFYPVYSGHCIAGNRIKTRNPEKTCKSFIKKRVGGRNYV